MKISFHGAAGTVTGSKHLITLEHGEHILLDCGMFQGLGKETLALNARFGFDASKVHHMILSHAHIDHSGLIPKLVKEGYRGQIYSTPATYDLCKIMLVDSARIQEADVRYVNKQKALKKQEPIEPLYTEKDVERCLEQFETLEYDQVWRINDHLTLQFTDNGHILGSATVNLKITDGGVTRRLAFTGDIGRYNTALLKDPHSFPQADILICESTYGDRLHDKSGHAEQEILDVIQDTCVRKKGKVIIPAFSLGRTQEVVFTLNKLDLHGLLPDVKVFVDSPLAVNATAIMRQYARYLNDAVQEFVLSRPDPFGYDWLTYITDKRESQKLNSMNPPFVIISSSGMAEAGRVKHHIMHNITDPRNTILIVGYAEPKSLSGRLRDGVAAVQIFGDYYPVEAEVRTIDSLSAHGDYEDMIRYLGCQKSFEVGHVFLVHGEPQAQEGFKKHLEREGYQNIQIPRQHEVFEV